MTAEQNSTSGKYGSTEYEMESKACSIIQSCNNPAIKEAIEKCVKKHYVDINYLRSRMYSEIDNILDSQEKP